MKLSTPQLVFLSLSVVGSAWTVRASQQDAVPTGRISQFENDEVKVWKSVVAPGSPLPLHRHEHPRVIIALVGGTMKIVEQGGVSKTNEWQSGKSYRLPANPAGTLHTDVNTGDKPIEVMVVELKKAH